MEKEQKKLSTGVVVLIITLVVALVTVSTILAYKILNEEEETNKPLTEVNNEQKEVEENKTEDKEENKVPEKEDETKEDSGDLEDDDENSEELAKKTEEFETLDFITSKIEKTENGYTITAHLLSNKEKTFTKDEYNAILNGKTVKFRGSEWEYVEEVWNGNLGFKPKGEEYEEGQALLPLVLEYNKDTGVYEGDFWSMAGKKTEIRDYLMDEKITFNVEEDVRWRGFNDPEISEIPVGEFKSVCTAIIIDGKIEMINDVGY